MWARLSPKGEGWGEGEGDAGQNRPGAPGWLRRFAATLRLADSPALRREAAQPTPDIPHQKDSRQTDKFKPGLDPKSGFLPTRISIFQGNSQVVSYKIVKRSSQYRKSGQLPRPPSAEPHRDDSEHPERAVNQAPPQRNAQCSQSIRSCRSIARTAQEEE